jgi:hypothetical protein
MAVVVLFEPLGPPMQLHEHPMEHLRKRDGGRNQGRKEVQTTGKKEATLLLPPPAAALGAFPAHYTGYA